MSASDSHSTPPPAREPNLLDLNALGDNNTLSLTVEASEHQDDRTHRLAEARRDGNVRRVKEVVSFAIGWFILLAIGYAASLVAFDNHPDNAPLASWGRTILGAITGALAGYVIGRKT